MSEKKSQREAQEEMLALGYIDNHGNVLEPFKLHEYCLVNRLSAPEADSVLGLPQGTTMLFTLQNGLQTLDGGEWPPSHAKPVPEGIQYGSGYEGTQAAPAETGKIYSPDDPLDPLAKPAVVETPEQRHERFIKWVEAPNPLDPVRQFIAYVSGARQQGFQDFEIETYTGWPQGTIDAVFEDLQTVSNDLTLVPVPLPYTDAT